MMLVAKLKTAGLALFAAGAFTVANLAVFAHGPAAAPVAAAAQSAADPVPPSPVLELPQVVVTFEATESAPSVFPPSADLLGHWKLEDAKVEDAGGAAAHGKVVAGATFADGKIGKALVVDGKGAHVELPSTEALDKVQEGSYTLAIWFRPDGVPAGTEKENGANYGLLMKTGWHEGLYYTNEKKFTVCHWIEGEKPDEPQWVGTGAWEMECDPGTWYHVVGVIDRAAGKVMCYVDGELKGTSEFAPNAPAKKYEKTTWKIGMANPGASDYAWPAKGGLDDARIYGRALSAAEVQTLYTGK